MVCVGEETSFTVSRSQSKATDQVQYMSFIVSREVDILLKSKTVQRRCEIFGERVIGIVHVNVEIPK